MKKFLLFALILLAFSSCGKKITLVNLYQSKDYQWHKNTLYIKVHWNIERPDADTVVADGYVEPFSPRTGLQQVRLELVGLDEGGNAVNSAGGRPRDERIISPRAVSPFRIAMKLNGRESDYTIRGSYYYYFAGTQPGFTTQQLDYIPLNSDDD